MVRKSKLTEDEIKKMYLSDVRINDIAAASGVTRQAIFLILKRIGVHEPNHGSTTVICAFCGDSFVVSKSVAKKRLYCSIPCYNADKDGIGYYGRRGTLEQAEISAGISTRRSRGRARKAINAETGEVVHHIDGNPFNNDPTNLMMFKSHAEHMRYHHRQRELKHTLK